MTSNNADFKPYKFGKTMKEAFLDEGQLFMLLRDAKEYSAGSSFGSVLADFISQLKPTNVFPSSFDFELNLEDYKAKFVPISVEVIPCEDYFSIM